MNLKDQVCSIYLSAILKEFQYESCFCWVKSSKHDGGYNLSMIDSLNKLYQEMLPAFTVAELGQILPTHIDVYSFTGPGEINISMRYKLISCAASSENGHILLASIGDTSCVDVYEKIWAVDYIDENGLSMDKFICDTKEADARAKMLIYLIENKLIKLKD